MTTTTKTAMNNSTVDTAKKIANAKADIALVESIMSGSQPVTSEQFDKLADIYKAAKATLEATEENTVEETAAEEKAEEKNFTANCYYTYTKDGVKWNGLKSKNFATATEAAQWILNYVKENDYTLTDGTQISDRNTHKTYNMTEADINAANSTEENAEEKFFYTTNRGNTREVTIGENGSTTRGMWYFYHEVGGMNEQDVIEVATKQESSEFATALCKFIATETDGSEDDAEETFTANVMPATVDDTEDELIDPHGRAQQRQLPRVD